MGLTRREGARREDLCQQQRASVGGVGRQEGVGGPVGVAGDVGARERLHKQAAQQAIEARLRPAAGALSSLAYAAPARHLTSSGTRA